jgi:hypothetical protein
MSKILTVATAVQVAVLNEVLLGEIATGFWKNARPADHADSWKGVSVVEGSELGASGFDVPRNYNFVNPDFFRRAEGRLLEAALTVNPDITVKQLKKQLISLNQILGARLKEVGGPISKLPRGRKVQAETATTSTPKRTATTSVRKVVANIVDVDTSVDVLAASLTTLPDLATSLTT